MSYKINAKNRRFKKNLIQIINLITLKKINNSGPQKIIVFSLFIILFGLNLPWIDIINNINDTKILNSFSSVLGITGYFVLIILFLLFTININKNLSSTIKSILKINIDDFILSFFLLIIVFSLTLNSLFIVEGMTFFKEGIIIGEGIIFTFVGTIIGIIASIFGLKEKTDRLIITKEEVDLEENKIKKEEKTIKLPF